MLSTDAPDSRPEVRRSLLVDVQDVRHSGGFPDPVVGSDFGTDRIAASPREFRGVRVRVRTTLVPREGARGRRGEVPVGRKVSRGTSSTTFYGHSCRVPRCGTCLLIPH